jgi:isocitrate dehydrogenase
VLREGNSDRRAPASVKQYVRKHPHSMGAWSSDSKTNVAHMTADDFRSTERSTVVARRPAAHRARRADGTTVVLRDVAGRPARWSTPPPCTWPPWRRSCRQIAGPSRGRAVLGPPQATMMKVSTRSSSATVRAFLPEVFAATATCRRRAHPNNGLGGIVPARAAADEGAEIKQPIEQGLATGPPGMVDSNRGHHQPARAQRRHRRRLDAGDDPHLGHMWGPGRQEHDTLAVIPDSSYAGIYQVVIDDCRAHGAYDPTTMGSVPNVGLMAQAAEEYGSHDKTFEVPTAGTVRVVDEDGTVVLETQVEQGDIWRMCQTKDVRSRTG